jgi:hypothetical protein
MIDEVPNNNTNQNTTPVTQVNTQPNWFDNQQELSFYVQNISSGDVILSDIGTKVPVLGVVDLRESHDIERLKKSSSLRQALSAKVNWLKRIDHEQYMRLLALQQKREDRISNQKKSISERKQSEALKESGGIQEQKVDISPKVKSMVEKYRLFHKGTQTAFTPEDFELFVEATKFNDDERAYVLGVVKEKTIQDAVLAQMDKK